MLTKQEELSVENAELRETLNSTVKENERLHEKIKYVKSQIPQFPSVSNNFNFYIFLFRNMENSAELLGVELKQTQIELTAAKDLADTRYAQLQHVSDLYEVATAKVLFLMI